MIIRLLPSFLEQASVSAFSFFLFIAAARLLSSDDLAVYTSLFSITQSFAFFLFGFVLLPISSSTGEVVRAQISTAISFLFLLLGGFVLVAPIAIGFFSGLDTVEFVEAYLLVIGLFVSHCLFETTRWLAIRLTGSHFVLPLSVLRLISFFSILIIIASSGLGVRAFTLTQIAVNLCVAAVLLIRLSPELLPLKIALPRVEVMRNFAIFGNTLSSFLINFTLVAVIDRVMGANALTSFQALRSASNVVGLVSQLLDNHYTSSLARTGAQLHGLNRLILISLILSVLPLFVIFFFREWIAATLFSTDIGEYALFLPILVLASIVNALSRPFFIQWRLHGDTVTLHSYSIVVIVLILPALLLLGLSGAIYTMVLLFALMPGVAAVIDLWVRRK
jgi:hypothetical protein